MKTLHHNQRLLLWILSEKPQTMRELAKTSKGSLTCIKQNVRNLIDRGLVYVSGHAPTKSTPAPIYATHIKHPKPKQSRVKNGGPTRVRDAIADILRDVGPMTIAEICEFSGMGRVAVQSTLSSARKGGKSSSIFRIAQWVWVEGQGHGWKAAFGIGPAADAPKPPSDKKGSQQRWEQRNRATRRLRSCKTTSGPFGQLLRFAASQKPSNDSQSQGAA